MKLFNNFWWNVKRLVLISPILALSSGSAYASAQFGMHHNVMPAWLAWGSAVGFELVYVLASLLNDESDDTDNKFLVVQAMAAITAIIYGVLYAADRYGVLEPMMIHSAVRWFLAGIHIVPLVVLSFTYVYFKHDIEATKKRVVRERAQAKERADNERKERIERERIQLEREREQAKAEKERLEKEYADTLRAKGKEPCPYCGGWFRKGGSFNRHKEACKRNHVA